MTIEELLKLSTNVNIDGSGIYAIVIKTTEKIYIGQSRRIRARIWEHLSSLRRKKHGNTYIQRSFDKYGEQDLQFLAIENCLKEELNGREEYWVSMVEKEKLLNLGAVGNYFPLSKEVIEKIRLKNIGRKISEETKIKISKAKKGVKSPLCGRPKSSEQKAHMSKVMKGRLPPIAGKKHSEETKKRMSASRRKDFSPMTGKHHTNETKEKIRQHFLGKKTGPRPRHEIEHLTLVQNQRKITHPKLLTINQVKEIKSRLLNEKIGKLAEEFKVSRATISDIKGKRTWSDIE